MFNYYVENKLMDELGWEWMVHYLTSNVLFMKMVQGYKVSMTKAAKLKLGVEVLKNANNAIHINTKNSNNNWQHD